MKAPPTISIDRSPVIGALRLAAFLGLIAVMVPIQWVHAVLRPDEIYVIPLKFHKLLLKILGFTVRTHGAVSTARPTLFVPNHASYLEIPVLGALIPASFVAKSEVAGWPFFGYLARLQNTVFIERRAARASAQKDDLRTLLAKGRNLIIFPEGTSSDGQTVLPFKSSLFGVVEAEGHASPLHVTVQPVSVSCTQLDGLPMTRALRPFYAWYGDMTLVNHLWRVFVFGRFTVDVIFHPPIAPENFTDRKALAAYCQRQVARGIEQCIAGRGLSHLDAPQLPARV